MAKRRKVEYDEGTIECFYCGKPVYESSWRCPNCGKWFREGRFSILGIIAIIVIVILLIVYVARPSFVFGEEEEEEEKKYGVLVEVNKNKNIAEPGGYTEWVIVTTSLSTVADTFEFTSENTGPLLATFDTPVIGLTSGQRIVNTLRVDVPAPTFPGLYDFRIYAASTTDSTANEYLDLTVEVATLSTRTVQSDDKVRCHYTLWLEDGTQEDDSYSGGVTLGVSINPANADDTYISVIPGFYNGMIGMKTGETKVVLVPPGQGYTDPNNTQTGHLANKPLYFQIELVSIDTG